MRNEDLKFEDLKFEDLKFEDFISLWWLIVGCNPCLHIIHN